MGEQDQPPDVQAACGTWGDAGNSGESLELANHSPLHSVVCSVLCPGSPRPWTRQPVLLSTGEGQ